MRYIVIIFIFVAMFACQVQHNKNNISAIQNVKGSKEEPIYDLPHIFIYRTTKDYRHNVPIIMSEDKTQIVSFPHPSDLIVDGKLTLPTQLKNGYLLDNRGIGKNVAFLKYTYAEYSMLKAIPTLAELSDNIIDKDPLIELLDCGENSNFTDVKKQINEWIGENLLEKKCKRIK